MDIRQFIREEVATRPRVLGGTAVVLALGMLTGGHLSIGKQFEPVEQAPIKPLPVTTPQPITLMTDANGKTPDYVIGTDNIPGRKRPPPPVVAAVDASDAREPRRAHWFWPPSWGRDRAQEERRYDRDRALAEADEAMDAPRPRYRPRYDAYETPRDVRRRERGDREGDDRRPPEDEEETVYRDRPPARSGWR